MTLILYDLEPRYEALADLDVVSADAGEESSLSEAVAAIRDEASTKALSLAKVVRCLDAEVQALEEQMRSLQAKAQSRRDRIALLRKLGQLELEASGQDRVRDALVTVWLQKSPPAVEVTDEAAVPPELMRAVLRLPYALVPPNLRGHLQHLDVDRATILELVKRTGEVPNGVSIRTGERHLRIR
jgi:hypothetical protein